MKTATINSSGTDEEGYLTYHSRFQDHWVFQDHWDGNRSIEFSVTTGNHFVRINKDCSEASKCNPMAYEVRMVEGKLHVRMNDPVQERYARTFSMDHLIHRYMTDNMFSKDIQGLHEVELGAAGLSYDEVAMAIQLQKEGGPVRTTAAKVFQSELVRKWGVASITQIFPFARLAVHDDTPFMSNDNYSYIMQQWKCDPGDEYCRLGDAAAVAQHVLKELDDPGAVIKLEALLAACTSPSDDAHASTPSSSGSGSIYQNITGRYRKDYRLRSALNAINVIQRVIMMPSMPKLEKVERAHLILDSVEQGKVGFYYMNDGPKVELDAPVDVLRLAVQSGMQFGTDHLELGKCHAPGSWYLLGMIMSACPYVDWYQQLSVSEVPQRYADSQDDMARAWLNLLIQTNEDCGHQGMRDFVWPLIAKIDRMLSAGKLDEAMEFLEPALQPGVPVTWLRTYMEPLLD